jgi:methionyl-tRNA formyltransferase
MKILFMGTTDFAAACLDSIIKAGQELVCVCTQPDKPKNRGMKLAYSPVKEYALKAGIDLIQPSAMKAPATAELLSSYKADIFVVVAYGRLLPKTVLDIPPLGCINVHASLLPKYRGSAPIQWAVIKGETVTGITTMYLSEGMDEGDMIDKASLNIEKYETFGSVYSRLMSLGAELITKTLSNIEAGTAVRTPQNHSEATYAPPINKDFCPIDWSCSPEAIVNKIRGLDPKPGATAVFNEKTYKLFTPKLTANTSSAPNGAIVGSGRQGLEIACGGGKTIIIEELQADGGKRMKAADYLRGHTL